MRTHYGPWQPCWISKQHQKHKSGRGPSNEHFCQVWLKSVQRFQRRRFKCEKLMDGWTLTHDKSSQGLWPGELKMNLPLYKGFMLKITNKWWPLTTLNRWPLFFKCIGRARTWPLWAGDHYTKVTVTTGLTIYLSITFCWKIYRIFDHHKNDTHCKVPHQDHSRQIKIHYFSHMVPCIHLGILIDKVLKWVIIGWSVPEKYLMYQLDQNLSKSELASAITRIFLHLQWS